MSALTPSPARAAFRDISNDVTPSPVDRKAAPVSGVCDQDTPQQASWTTGDQFQFVEEDDDEVLFRVRDSGVLRSLALPGLSQPEVVTPPNAVNASETLEQKQVCHPLPDVLFYSSLFLVCAMHSRARIRITGQSARTSLVIRACEAITASLPQGRALRCGRR